MSLDLFPREDSDFTKQYILFFGGVVVGLGDGVSVGETVGELVEVGVGETMGEESEESPPEQPPIITKQNAPRRKTTNIGIIIFFIKNLP